MRHQNNSFQSRSNFSSRPSGGTSSAGAARDNESWD